jgi:peroxiredoxin Q/BCP
LVEWFGLPLGVKAPDFDLPNECNNMVHLADLLGKKPVLLAFYCSDFGVMCSVEMIGLRDRYDKFGPLCHLLAISTNTTYSHGAWSDSLKLPFPLLSDLDGAVSKSYNVWPPDGLSGYLEGRSLRAVLILDKEGVVRYCWAPDDPGLEPNYLELLDVLRALQAGP